jgi:hypothetical protein
VQPAENCAPIRDGLADAVQSAKPDVVVLLLGNYEVYDRGVDGRSVRVGSNEYERFLVSELNRTVDDASRDDVPVIVLTPPCLSPANPVAAAPETGVYAPARLTWLADVFTRFGAGRPSDTTGLDLQALVCPDGIYREQVDDVTLYTSGTRFTPEGAELIWDWLLPSITALRPS